MKDPTREEMIAVLQASWYGAFEMVEDEIEEAMYQFASENHSGQSSNLYEALSQSPFKPGPLWKECRKNSIAADIMAELEARFK